MVTRPQLLRVTDTTDTEAQEREDGCTTTECDGFAFAGADLKQLPSHRALPVGKMLHFACSPIRRCPCGIKLRTLEKKCSPCFEYTTLGVRKRFCVRLVYKEFCHEKFPLSSAVLPNNRHKSSSPRYFFIVQMLTVLKNMFGCQPVSIRLPAVRLYSSPQLFRQRPIQANARLMLLGSNVALSQHPSC